jgi:RNA polymerase sigma factor (sigma-70 family)
MKITPKKRDSQLEERDEQLVQRCVAGQREAFDELCCRYQQQVYIRVRHIVGNDADAWDAVQNSFSDAFARLDQFERRASFKTWLMSIAYNAAIDILRKKNRQRASEKRYAAMRLPVKACTSNVTLLDHRMVTLIKSFLQDLATAEMQQFYVLYFQEELSLRKIADKLEKTVWQVRKTRNQLFSEVQEVLARQGWSVD